MSKEERNETPKYIKVLEDDIDKLDQRLQGVKEDLKKVAEKIDSVARESRERDGALLKHIKTIWTQLGSIREILEKTVGKARARAS